ncbi:hypothetical protein EYF80_034830 [Liparis tanakae]|uniref:Uncharacterized protein n=1 Tax=Liparis tanakae TaxID=230148 RepID=A0A4Z2GQH2_9TELE|nr:hypothetical protein EYF80_034830 [Liparis tanakae]
MNPKAYGPLPTQRSIRLGDAVSHPRRYMPPCGGITFSIRGFYCLGCRLLCSLRGVSSLGGVSHADAFESLTWRRTPPPDAFAPPPPRGAPNSHGDVP